MSIVEDVGWCFDVVWRCLPGASALRRCRRRLATICVLPEASQHELQNDLQMASNCSGLGGAQERPSCEPKLAAVSARPGAT